MAERPRRRPACRRSCTACRRSGRQARAVDVADREADRHVDHAVAHPHVRDPPAPHPPSTQLGDDLEVGHRAGGQRRTKRSPAPRQAAPRRASSLLREWDHSAGRSGSAREHGAGGRGAGGRWRARAARAPTSTTRAVRRRPQIETLCFSPPTWKASADPRTAARRPPRPGRRPCPRTPSRRPTPPRPAPYRRHRTECGCAPVPPPVQTVARTPARSCGIPERSARRSRPEYTPDR